MRAWRAAFLGGPALLLAAALIIPLYRARPSGSPPPIVSAVATAGRLHVALEGAGGGPPAFSHLTPAPDGVRLVAPPAWPSDLSPRWDLPSGSETAYVVTVAPDGSLSSVAPVGAPTVPREVVETVAMVLRASRFTPYSAAEPATVALLVSLPPPS